MRIIDISEFTNKPLTPFFHLACSKYCNHFSLVPSLTNNDRTEKSHKNNYSNKSILKLDEYVFCTNDN